MVASRLSKQPKLQRAALRTSRLLDFCSRKELIAQTGHEPDAWPLVVFKELADNSCDSCEDAGIAPVIAVGVNAKGITVTDNGPGLPLEIIEGVLDFSVRVSSREAYASPTRGAQGNALKTVVAMPFVLDGQIGRVAISAHGSRHDIAIRVDRIRQQPVIDLKPRADKSVKTGTVVRVYWPNSACLTLKRAKARFLQLAEDYTFLNPHLSLGLDWFGDRKQVHATDPNWKKWLPSRPTSPHWYDPERFDRLIAGYIAHDADRDRDRSVREFVAEFAGLSATANQKKVLQATGLARVGLAALRNRDGLNQEHTSRLLAVMKEQTKVLKPQVLGSIGKEHLGRRFTEHGCNPETFKYRREMGLIDGVPWVVETAFAYCPEAAERRLVTGVNWSPGIINPFRQLGQLGESLDSLLERQRAGRDEPVLLLLHLVCPRVEYTDRGKSAVVIGGQARRTS